MSKALMLARARPGEQRRAPFGLIGYEKTGEPIGEDEENDA